VEEEAWDVPLDFVATERELIDCSGIDRDGTDQGSKAGI
jgi:hypothetical protein